MLSYKDTLMINDVYEPAGLVKHYRKVLEQACDDENYDYKYHNLRKMPEKYQWLFLFTALSGAKDIKDCFVARYMDDFKYINQFLYTVCKDKLDCDFTVDGCDFMQIEYLDDISIEVDNCASDAELIYQVLSESDMFDLYPDETDFLEETPSGLCPSDLYYTEESHVAQGILDGISEKCEEFAKARNLYVIDNSQYELIGGEIKHIRTGMGLTQEQFAQKFAMNKGTLAHWEQGHRKPPIYISRMLEMIWRLESQVETLTKAGRTVADWIGQLCKTESESFVVCIKPADKYMSTECAVKHYGNCKVIAEPKVQGAEGYRCVDITITEE